MKEIIRTLLLIVFILLSSCRDSQTEKKRILEAFIGKDITFPERLVCQILTDTIDIRFDKADYTIVSYIDSVGCTSCKMNLRKWDKVIGEFKFLDDVEVNFIMILNSKDIQELNRILKKYHFLHPVFIDGDNSFFTINEIPNDEFCHTFLLDDDFNVVLAGDPSRNPKILELYRNIILEGETEDFQPGCSISLGAVSMGSNVKKLFEIRNDGNKLLTIQEFATSCDCVNVSANIETIKADETAILTVNINVDSIKGPFKRYVDVYFYEEDSPRRYTLSGYTI